MRRQKAEGLQFRDWPWMRALLGGLLLGALSFALAQYESALCQPDSFGEKALCTVTELFAGWHWAVQTLLVLLLVFLVAICLAPGLNLCRITAVLGFQSSALVAPGLLQKATIAFGTMLLLVWLAEGEAPLSLHYDGVGSISWMLWLTITAVAIPAVCGLLLRLWTSWKASRASKKPVEGAHDPEQDPRALLNLPELMAGKEAKSAFEFTDEGLLAWIERDEPVEDKTQDVLGTRKLAAHIAETLFDKDTPAMPGLVLAGPQGSGKTTVGKFLRGMVNPRKVHVVQLSAWDFVDSLALRQGIVREVLGVLLARDGSLSLRLVATQYTQAVSSAHPLLSFLLGVLGAGKNPEQSIARLNTAFKRHGRYCVLWVDDLERFATGSTATTEGEARDANRATHAESLLHLLARQSHIAVVVATTSAKEAPHIRRMTQHAFRVPRLSRERGRKLLHLFANKVLQRGATLVSDGRPLTDENKGQASRAANGFVALHDFRFAGQNKNPGDLSLDGEVKVTPIEAFAMSLSLRDLKFALRACKRGWSDCRGEVDPKEFLAVRLLEAGSPSLLAFCEEQFESLLETCVPLRVGYDDTPVPPAADTEDMPKDYPDLFQDSGFRSDFHEAVRRDGLTPEQREPAWRLILWLFARGDQQAGVQSFAYERSSKHVKLGVAHDAMSQIHERWRRLVDMRVDADRLPRDQCFLKRIQTANTSQSSDAIKGLLDQLDFRKRQSWRFSSLLSERASIALLDAFAARCAASPGSGSGSGSASSAHALEQLGQVLGPFVARSRRSDLPQHDKDELSV